jgi:tRNA wybutosine-synthesizing protein 3
MQCHCDYGTWECPFTPLCPVRWFSPNVKGSVVERPVQRTMHACASIREKVFIFGGLSADGSLLNDVWVFDQDSVLWSCVNCYGSLPSARQGVCGYLMGRSTYFVAQNSLVHHGGLIFLYHFLCAQGASICASEDGRRMYLFGGNDGSKALNDVYYLDLEKLHWNSVQVHVSLPQRTDHSSPPVLGFP